MTTMLGFFRSTYLIQGLKFKLLGHNFSTDVDYCICTQGGRCELVDHCRKASSPCERGGKCKQKQVGSTCNCYCSFTVVASITLTILYIATFNIIALVREGASVSRSTQHTIAIVIITSCDSQPPCEKQVQAKAGGFYS